MDEHPTDITRMLQGLCDRGFLISDNRRRWTTYALPSEGTTHGGASGSPRLPSSSTRLPENRGGSEGTPILREEDDSQPPGKAPDSDVRDDATLRAVARPVASRGKAPPAEVEAVILALCQGRYLTAEQIGALLNRNPERVRDVYLSKLVKEGRLRMRFPEAVNSPNQAYAAKDGN